MLVPSSDVAASTACDREDDPRRVVVVVVVETPQTCPAVKRVLGCDRGVRYPPEAVIGPGCWYHTQIPGNRNRAHNGSASRQSAAMTTNAVPPIQP